MIKSLRSKGDFSSIVVYDTLKNISFHGFDIFLFKCDFVLHLAN